MRFSTAVSISLLSLGTLSVAQMGIYERSAYPEAYYDEMDVFERDAYPEAYYDEMDVFERDAYPEAYYEDMDLFERDAYPDAYYEEADLFERDAEPEEWFVEDSYLTARDAEAAVAAVQPKPNYKKDSGTFSPKINIPKGDKIIKDTLKCKAGKNGEDNCSGVVDIQAKIPKH
ncbi:hypothetical protein MMC13_007336 [Lambiella insularis]|nr:hypothetical protein [Lambiella insularis]